MKTPAYAKNNHWLNVVKIDKGILSKDIDALILDMKLNNIEVRPI